MTDVGDSVERVESLLEELDTFQKSSQVYICYYIIIPLSSGSQTFLLFALFWTKFSRSSLLLIKNKNEQ